MLFCAPGIFVYDAVGDGRRRDMMTSCGVVDRNVRFFFDEKEMIQEFAALVKVDYSFL